jgi:hypothetical protein
MVAFVLADFPPNPPFPTMPPRHASSPPHAHAGNEMARCVHDDTWKLEVSSATHQVILGAACSYLFCFWAISLPLHTVQTCTHTPHTNLHVLCAHVHTHTRAHYTYQWLRWGFDPFIYLTASEVAEMILGKHSDTRIKPLALTNDHGRYITVAVTPERTLASVGEFPLHI